MNFDDVFDKGFDFDETEDLLDKYKEHVFEIIKEILKQLLRRYNIDKLDDEFLAEFVERYFRPIIDLRTTLTRIVQSRALSQVFAFLSKHKAAAPPVIQHHTKLPQRSVYWALDELQAMGFIEPIPISSHEKGRPPVVWKFITATPEDVAKAAETYRLMKTPGYKIMLKVLEEFPRYFPYPLKEVTWERAKEVIYKIAGGPINGHLLHRIRVELQKRGWRFVGRFYY